MRAIAFVVILSIALLSTGALAEVPGLMSYQGTLTDSNGVALDTTVSMTFSIYTDSVAGTQVWSETQSSVTISHGIFNVLLGNPGLISDYYGIDVPQKPCKPLILMPTTAGTGSEISQVAAISDSASGKKFPVLGPNCTASLAIVDPLLTLELPPELTASTGVDALAHAIEAYTSGLSSPFSEEAVNLFEGISGGAGHSGWGQSCSVVRPYGFEHFVEVEASLCSVPVGTGRVADGP